MRRINGLSRIERLKGRTAVSGIFEGSDNKTFLAFPLRAVYKRNSESVSRILISVPKRHLHHAVDRNHVKRQVREAYRLNKQKIAGDTHYDIAFIYLTDRICPSTDIAKQVIALLEKICPQSQET